MHNKQNKQKEEFIALRDDARNHFAQAVDCLARAYLTPYIQKKLSENKKLDQKDIIKKVDVASRMIYVETLKRYFGIEENSNGKSGKIIEVKSYEEANRGSEPKA